MDYIVPAGIILCIWTLLRILGNERESRLRLLESRIRQQAEAAARAAAERENVAMRQL
jgi:hypothetical protein